MGWTGKRRPDQVGGKLSVAVVRRGVVATIARGVAYGVEATKSKYRSSGDIRVADVQTY